jgi:hypothetical protein
LTPRPPETLPPCWSWRSATLRAGRRGASRSPSPTGLRGGRGAAAEAGARATIASDDLLALARGRLRWPQLLTSGRFELSGDPFLAPRFAALFRLPVALDPVSASR